MLWLYYERPEPVDDLECRLLQGQPGAQLRLEALYRQLPCTRQSLPALLRRSQRERGQVGELPVEQPKTPAGVGFIAARFVCDRTAVQTTSTTATAPTISRPTAMSCEK